MATPKQIRRRGRWSIVLGTILATLAFGAVYAYADGVQVDNDTASPGLQNSVDLNATAGGSVNTSAQLVIDFSGQKHLTTDQTVTLHVNAAQTNLPAGYSVGNASVAIGGTWTTGSTATGTSNISFTAPSTPGDYTYTVKWTGTKDTDYTCDSSTAANQDCLTGGSAFTINLHVTAPVCTPTYSATFLPPFDGVYPGSQLITNTMKNGRVVPVKTTIIDSCTNAPVTNLTGETVSINVTKNPTNSGSVPPDPVESYADAGSSNAGTNLFRWSTDGFWIYNLDSKGLGLITGTTYRVNIYVNSTLATGYALLKPVK